MARMAEPAPARHRARRPRRAGVQAQAAQEAQKCHDLQTVMARPYRCLDRMCGAEDCERCHPGNFVDGVYIDDTEQDEDEDDETEYSGN